MAWTATAPTNLPDPIQGGGVWTGTGWVPKSHPNAVNAVQPGQTGPLPSKVPAPAPAGTSSQTTMTSTTGYTGTPGSTFNTPAGTPPGGPTIQSSFRNALLGQLGTDPNNVSLNDPGLRPQMQAFQNAQQRSQGRAQQELAEQAFAGGSRNTGAYGAELGAMEQARGEAEAGYGAGLLGQERERRTQNLFNALGLGQGQIQSDEALRLQRQLGLSDLELRKMLGQGQLSLGTLQALLGNRQFNDQLGANLGMFGANLNQNALQWALGPQAGGSK